MASPNPPIPGARLSYLFIKVRDLEAMTSFYCETLGFDVVYREANNCAFFGLPGNEGLLVGFIPDDTAAAGPGNSFVTIDTNDLNAAHKHLGNLGVDTSTVFKVPYGRAFQIADPEGNTVEIHQMTNEQ